MDKIVMDILSREKRAGTNSVQQRPTPTLRARGSEQSSESRGQAHPGARVGLPSPFRRTFSERQDLPRLPSYNDGPSHLFCRYIYPTQMALCARRTLFVAALFVVACGQVARRFRVGGRFFYMISDFALMDPADYTTSTTQSACEYGRREELGSVFFGEEEKRKVLR